MLLSSLLPFQSSHEHEAWPFDFFEHSFELGKECRVSLKMIFRANVFVHSVLHAGRGDAQVNVNTVWTSHKVSCLFIMVAFREPIHG